MIAVDFAATFYAMAAVTAAAVSGTAVLVVREQARVRAQRQHGEQVIAALAGTSAAQREQQRDEVTRAQPHTLAGTGRARAQTHHHQGSESR